MTGLTTHQFYQILDLLRQIDSNIGNAGSGSLGDVLLANLEINNSLHYNGGAWVNNYLGNRYILNNGYTIPEDSQLVIKEELILNGAIELIVDGDLYIDTQ